MLNEILLLMNSNSLTKMFSILTLALSQDSWKRLNIF